jgi:hypothetical protein
VYDGPALVDGSMSVADLAPALLALGDQFVEASMLAYPDREPVALNIRATEKGSFLVELAIHSPDTWDQFVNLFSGQTVTALMNLKGLIIGSTAGSGLFWLIKKLHGRRIERTEIESGHVRLTLDDGTTLEVPADVWRMHGNVQVRRKARTVVEPVTRDGVDRLEFREDKQVTVSITKEDLPAYEVPEPEEKPLGASQGVLTLEVTSATFKEENKWRFSDGDASFAASIEDEDFLRRVDLGKAFRKGDMLRCRMVIEQSQRAEKLHTERRIVEVLEHIPRPEQLRLGDPPGVGERGSRGGPPQVD